MIRVTSFGAWCDVFDRHTRQVEYRPGTALRDLLPDDFDGRSDVSVVMNGKHREDLSIEVPDGSLVGYFVKPEGPFIAGVVLPAIISAAASLLVNLLLPNRPGRDLRDDESPSYGFTRLSQVRTEGLPIQSIFGVIRTAGTIIREESDVIGLPPKSFYRALVSFGHGVIEALGDRRQDTDSGSIPSTDDQNNPIPSGIQVQENAAENYSGTKIQFRRGALEQSAVSGHPGAVTQRTVDLELESDNFSSSNASFALPTQSQQLIQDVDYSSPAAVHPASLYPGQSLTNDAVWDAYGETFDMTDKSDRFEVILSFTRGLGLAANDGSIQDAGVRCAIRYRELDDLGVPITTGPPGGYVRLPFEPLIVSNTNEPFQVKLGRSFVDPQTYSPGTTGGAAQFTIANDGHMRLRSALGPSGSTNYPASYAPAPGSQITGVGFVGWVRINDASTIGKKQVIASHMDSNQGWALYIENEEFFGQSTPVLKFAYKTPPFGFFVIARQDPQFGSPAFTIPAGTWVHVGFHYGVLGTGQPTRFVQLWQNGQVVLSNNLENEIGSLIEAPLSTDFDLGWAYDEAGGFFPDTFDGDMDEVRIYGFVSAVQSTLSGLFITNYNGGAGVSAQVDPQFAAQHFVALPLDAESIANARTDDLTGFANHAEFYQGAATGGAGVDVGTIGGLVQGLGVQEPKRMRAQVQVLRLNPVNTNDRVFDDVTFLFFKEILDEEFRYPGVAYASIEVEAQGQLNTSRPDSTYLVSGRHCPTWDGLSVDSPILVSRFTANNAWVALCVLLDKVAGLGEEIAQEDIDLVAFKALADRCDEFVFDQLRPSLASAQTQFDFEDVQYDSTGDGGAGTLNILFASGAARPAHWQVGTRLMLKLPEPNAGWIENSGVYVRLDDGSVDSYEIVEIIPGTGQVRVRYGRNADGAPWPDGQNLSNALTGSPADLTGTTARIESRHHRHEWNGEVDTEKPAWEWIKDILRPALAAPIRIGRKVSVRFESPRQATDMVGQAQILRRGEDGAVGPSTFSFEYLEPEELSNSVQTQIRNQFRNYAYSPVGYKDPATNDASSSVREETVRLDGVTHPAEARRFALHQVKRNRLTTKRGSFEVGLEALPWLEGDVLLISHELLQGGYSGRNTETQASQTAITIDRQLEVAASMQVTVRSNSQDQLVTVNITSTPGSYPKGSVIACDALGFVPEKDDPWIAGTPLSVEIARQRLTENGRRRVDWVEFTNDVFDDSALDDEFLDATLVASGGQILASTLAGVPDSPRLESRLARQRDGTKVPKIFASWSVPESGYENVRSMSIQYRKDRGVWKEGVTVPVDLRSADFVVDRGEPGELFEVALQPINESGLFQDPERCYRLPVLIPRQGDPPPPVQNPTYRVIENSLIFEWDLPSLQDAPPLIVEARRGGWVLGQVAFRAPAGSRSYDLGRDLTAGVYELRTVDAFGDYSEGVQVVVPDEDVPGDPNWTADYPTEYYEQEWSEFGVGWCL